MNENEKLLEKFREDTIKDLKRLEGLIKEGKQFCTILIFEDENNDMLAGASFSENICAEEVIGFIETKKLDIYAEMIKQQDE